MQSTLHFSFLWLVARVRVYPDQVLLDFDINSENTKISYKKITVMENISESLIPKKKKITEK
jgi:hypothetical protein